MLKHGVDAHKGSELDVTRFGMKIIANTKSAFERQIQESVYLQENVHHHLLNSKSEYNRCAIPRLITKLGGKELKENREEEEREKKHENMIEMKIRMLRKKNNKGRKKNR